MTHASNEDHASFSRSVNVRKKRSIISYIYLVSLGVVSITIVSLAMGYYGIMRVALTFTNNLDDSNMILGLLFPADSSGRSLAAATTSNKTVGDKGETTTKQTRAVIAAYIEDEVNKAVTNSAVTLNSSEPSNTCGNSELWLQGPRYGNLHDDPYLTDDVAQHMILNLQNVLLKDSGMRAVLGQTICHADSRFLNSTQPEERYLNDQTVRLWAVKLIYIAVHYHQHRMAAPEAVTRYRSNSQCPSASKLKQDYGVGVFDYECPNAKYIIMPLSGNGLGANVRGGMVVAMLMGLVSDRIVIFVNKAAGGSKFLKSAWQLASCPRKDYQCFFWPTTPCTLTQNEIDNAYELTRAEYRKLMKESKEVKPIEHHKVWYFKPHFTPLVSLPTRAAETLYQHALSLISAVSETENPEYVTLLKGAAEAIRTNDDPREGYNYAAASLKVHHAISFYSMRPNPHNAHKLDRILSDIIPSSFQSDTSVGLPIRGELEHSET